MKKICDVLGNSLFLIMLSMWVSGYFFYMALISCEIFIILISSALSISSFSVGYVLYKSEFDEKKRRDNLDNKKF